MKSLNTLKPTRRSILKTSTALVASVAAPRFVFAQAAWKIGNGPESTTDEPPVRHEAREPSRICFQPRARMP